MYCIYTLSDPHDGSIRYIGKTKNTANRFNAHMSAIQGEGSLSKRNWIKNLKSQGLKPVFSIIEESLTSEQACEREKYWIRHYVKQGTKLYNQASIRLSPEEILGLIKAYQDLAENAISPDAAWKADKEVLDKQSNDILSQLSSQFYLRVFNR